jgi:hypothetical protein
MSEDLCVFIADDFDEEARAEAEQIRLELGIFSDEMEVRGTRPTEYPGILGAGDIGQVSKRA